MSLAGCGGGRGVRVVGGAAAAAVVVRGAATVVVRYAVVVVLVVREAELVVSSSAELAKTEIRMPMTANPPKTARKGRARPEDGARGGRGGA